MTLVVAGIHDEDRITMVADTKITWVGDPERTRRTYENALAKIILLRKNLAVGVAGNDPHGCVRLLAELRDVPVEELLEALRQQDHAEFVVASLDPARLWMVRDGDVDERADGVRAWAGEPAAFSRFQGRYADWAGDDDVPHRLMSSLQHLTSFDPVSTVGGYTIRTTGSPTSGFLFPPDYMVRFPAPMRAVRGQVHDGKLTVTFEVPPGVDPTISELFVFAGRGATRGAIGLLHPLAKAGRLFRHEAPDESVTVAASTPDEFVRVALEEHGQEIVHGGRPQGLEFLG